MVFLVTWVHGFTAGCSVELRRLGCKPLGVRTRCLLFLLPTVSYSGMTASCPRHACLDPLVFHIHQVRCSICFQLPHMSVPRYLVCLFPGVYDPDMFYSKYLIYLLPGTWYVCFKPPGSFSSKSMPIFVFFWPLHPRSHMTPDRRRRA